jgi:hypothetical protein
MQPVASPYPGTAPALAVYDGTVFLAWTQETTDTVECGSSPCFRLMYATLPPSASAWSSATPIQAFSSAPLAPALGVNLGSLEGMNPGLFLAYFTGSPAIVGYSQWVPPSTGTDDGSWSEPVAAPGLPIPPGPLTPALVFTDTTSTNGVCTYTSQTFSLVYAAPVSGQSYDDIYLAPLQNGFTHGCLTPPPTQ